jgi:hypothetical protein
MDHDELMPISQPVPSDPAFTLAIQFIFIRYLSRRHVLIKVNSIMSLVSHARNNSHKKKVSTKQLLLPSLNAVLLVVCEVTIKD